MARRRRQWWGWLLCLALACGVARGEARNPVEKLAADAASAYRSGDFQRAAQLLERAYKLQPVSALLYNLAKAYEKLGDEDKAAELFSRYAGADDADPKLKAKAEARVAALRESAPPAPRERQRASRERETDREPERQREAAPAHEQPAAQPPPPATVEPAKPAAPPTPPETPEARAHRRDRSVGIAVTAIGGGALISAIGLSGSVLSLKSTFSNSLDETTKRNATDAAMPQAIAADVLYVVGAAAIAVGAYFLWRGYHRESKPMQAGLRF